MNRNIPWAKLRGAPSECGALRDSLPVSTKCKRAGLLLTLTFSCLSASAWQLTPEGSFIERKLASRSQGALERMMSSWAMRGVHVFGDSVHEEITNRVLGCEGDTDICGDPEYDPDNAYYLAGVRWNDDPPFRFGAGQGDFGGCAVAQTVRLTTQPVCWANTFRDGKSRATSGVALDGSNSTILVRSHFGDMQFLHAMASKEKESPELTRASILAWAEFAWRLSLGEFDLEAPVAGLDIPGFSTLFKNNREWRVQDLFALGNPHIRSRDALSKVAFGSLLHTVQDSFASGHVERRPPTSGQMCLGVSDSAQPGKILEFHSYTGQDSKKHGEGDSRDAFSAHWTADRRGVIDVGRTLRKLNQSRTPWTQTKPYLECIFALDGQSRNASSGVGFGIDD